VKEGEAGAEAEAGVNSGSSGSRIIGPHTIKGAVLWSTRSLESRYSSLRTDPFFMLTLEVKNQTRLEDCLAQVRSIYTHCLSLSLFILYFPWVPNAIIYLI
jgi:hypothetical protein